MKRRIWFYVFVVAGLLTPRLQFIVKKGAPVKVSNANFGFAEARAGASPNCDALVQNVFANVPTPGQFADPIVGHFHEQLYRFNKVETVDVEMIFCRLIYVLGFDPDLNNLPQTYTKGDPRGHSVSVTVSVPTESFAASLGYVAKAEISHDNVVFLKLWWAGRGAESKGYLIQGLNPMQIDGMKRLRYIQWDRAADAQFVKILGTQFASSYLSNPSGSAESKTGGDGAHYGRATYNASSKAISGQSVHIRAQSPGSSNFVCIKTLFSGTLGGTLSGYRPANGTPDPVTDTNVDGTHMDGRANMIDSPTSVNTGTYVSQPAALPEPLDMSCAALNGMGGAGKAFEGNNVNFSAQPSAIFPH